MKLFSFFRKRKPQCRHYKQAGFPALANMEEVISFSDCGDDVYIFPYAIGQCKKCGKRAFGCVHYPAFSPQEIRAIDSFIAYEITLNDLIAFFEIKKIPYEARGKD